MRDCILYGTFLYSGRFINHCALVTDYKKYRGGVLRIVCCGVLAATILCGCGKSVSDKADEAVEQGNQAAILFNQQEYTKALSAISHVISLNSELKRDSALGGQPFGKAVQRHQQGIIHRDLKPGNVIVSGGSTNPYWQYGGMRYEKTVSIDKWR